MTLKNLTTSFQDWKYDRCNKGLHSFNEEVLIHKDFAKPVYTCSNCNTNTIVK
jgi:hypothetical protein